MINYKKELKIKKLRREGIIPISTSSKLANRKQKKKRKTKLKPNRKAPQPKPKPRAIMRIREQKPYTITRAQTSGDSYKEIVFDKATARRILSDLVEQLVITYLKKNHVKIIKKIYPQQTEFTSIAFRRTDPMDKERVGREIPKRGRTKYITGWNGDAVFLLSDKELGKRAVIFEIKFGFICISESQSKFFRAVRRAPGEFLNKLKEAKVFIVHCHSFDMNKRTIKLKFINYQKLEAL